MAKNLKINIKNTQIAEALNLKKIKKKVKKADSATEKSEEELPKKKKARILSTEEIAKAEKAKAEKASLKAQKAETPKTKKPSKQAKVVDTEKTVKAEEKPVITSSIQKPKIIKHAPDKEPKKEKEPAEKAKKQADSKEEKKAEPAKPKKPVFKEEKVVSRKELKPKKTSTTYKVFDSRDRMGLRSDEDERWRKRRSFHKRMKKTAEEPPDRPKKLTVRLPVTIKELASLMKLKASELISKLFLQGIVITLNDFLDDETTIQLLGHEFGCDIIIDRSEEERLQITSQSIKEEVESASVKSLETRPPVVTFMGHVDHGKTSLIDAIRKSNITSTEAGAITQHIGAFSAQTSFGFITILDTPGHEAFSEMRERGANVTDVIVLVIAGDEGIREQTIEALQQARSAKVPIVVAINKSDKEGYDPEKIYRQMSDHNLVPEAWGGDVITINCSAATKEGIDQLLELISLQAEILELKANPSARGRGTILESQMHKGLGPIATVLIQNGTLRINDAIVFGNQYGRIKTMQNQYGKNIETAFPSYPAEITGLSSLAEAGLEFIVVPSEKEAKKLAHDRKEEFSRTRLLKSKKASLDGLMKQQTDKKILPLILKADVQGSLEALAAALQKLPQEKVTINIVKAEVGEISESDVDLAQASDAPIIGFHTKIESNAADLIAELKIPAYMNDVIYHVIDKVKKLMVDKLDKIAEENNTGQAEVKALFQSSQVGTIAGCQVVDGILKRGQMARVIREDEEILKAKISSLKRGKDDVKEVLKGQECGILLENFDKFQEKDIIKTFDVTYLEPEL